MAMVNRIAFFQRQSPNYSSFSLVQQLVEQMEQPGRRWRNPILVSTKKQIPKLEDKAEIQQATTVDNEAQSVSCPAPSALEPSFQSQSPRLHFSLLHTELRKLLGGVSDHVAVINQPGWSTRQLALLSVSNRDEHGSLLLASSRARALPNCSVIIATRGQPRRQLVVARQVIVRKSSNRAVKCTKCPGYGAVGSL